MSVEVKEQTPNKLHVEYDVSKLFLRNNRYISLTFTNTTGGDLSLEPGQVIGKIAASGKAEVLKSGAGDGSEIPVGILASSVVDLPDTQSTTVQVCVSGDVAEEKILLDGADTLDTLIGGRSIRDRIGGDTVGVILNLGEDLTNSDNS